MLSTSTRKLYLCYALVFRLCTLKCSDYVKHYKKVSHLICKRVCMKKQNTYNARTARVLAAKRTRRLSWPSHLRVALVARVALRSSKSSASCVWCVTTPVTQAPNSFVANHFVVRSRESCYEEIIRVTPGILSHTYTCQFALSSWHCYSRCNSSALSALK